MKASKRDLALLDKGNILIKRYKDWDILMFSKSSETTLELIDSFKDWKEEHKYFHIPTKGLKIINVYKGKLNRKVEYLTSV